MPQGKKILITGVSGMVGKPIATALAKDNEVWGLARFRDGVIDAGAMGTDPASRSELEAAGIITRAVDMGAPDLSDVPQDFDIVLHLAHTRLGADFGRAVKVNAVGAGHILQHCRNAGAALVMSSAALYCPKADLLEPQREDDPIGRAFTPWAPSSPVSKVSLEAVASFCAEAFDLPVLIARLFTIYGGFGGYPMMHAEDVAAGRKVTVPADPNGHSPIHVDDVLTHLDALLDAATTTGNIVNLAGDEVITSQHWSTLAGKHLGKDVEFDIVSIPGALNSSVADVTKRQSITGPLGRSFDASFGELLQARFPK